MPAKVFDVFDHIPQNVREDVIRRALLRHYTAGSVVYAQGDPGRSIFRVLSGEIRLSVSRSDGRELYYVYFGPGDCFGASNFVDGLPRPQTAQAVTALELQVLRCDVVEALCEVHPTFTMALMKMLARHMRVVIDLFADAGLNDLAERIARRLVDATDCREAEDRCGRISVNLSQSDIAHLVGASRQSVNKVLQRFQDEQLITTEYGGVVVEAPERLRQWANAGALTRS